MDRTDEQEAKLATSLFFGCNYLENGNKRKDMNAPDPDLQEIDVSEYPNKTLETAQRTLANRKVQIVQ